MSLRDDNAHLIRPFMGESCSGEVLSRIDERQFVVSIQSEAVPQLKGQLVAEWVKDNPDEDEPEPAPGDQVEIWCYGKPSWFFFFVDERIDVHAD